MEVRPLWVDVGGTITTLAIIPARGGSKGIPRKNLAPCGGQPLLYWTMQAASKSSIDQTFVSSEDYDIRNYVDQTGFATVSAVDRPFHLAEDDSSSSSVLEYHLADLKWDVGVMLQPTSPLREARHIDEALNLLYLSDADCVVSVVEDHPLLWMGDVTAPEPTFNTDLRPRRQDITDLWRENGAIYVFRRAAWDLIRNQVCGRVVLYRMSEEHWLDVDTFLDIAIADMMIQARQLNRVAVVPSESLDDDPSR